jgi:small redox-active disulfide protein 2
MVIKVLGTGCASCKTLESHTRRAVDELGIGADVVKVDDMGKILEYNIIRTPAIIIDEKVVTFGKVLSIPEIKDLIIQHSR